MEKKERKDEKERKRGKKEERERENGREKGKKWQRKLKNFFACDKQFKFTKGKRI